MTINCVHCKVHAILYCKSCDKCQKHTKQSPKHMPMQEREVVSVPSERVCVDIVGPFPTAKGGF